MTPAQDKIKLFTPVTLGLLIVIIAGALAVYKKLTLGEITTNLQDDFPWGLWIGFNVLGGVAMAAGGFVIASAVYLLNMKKYKPIARPAILTAFIGYLLAAFTIFLDIGHPMRIWHPMVMWQIRSVMFIVAIHVILYTTVLGLESSPMLLEKLKLGGLKKIIEKLMVPIALFGTLLSVLHQSSLGAVYLIVPDKLHSLWYSQTLPFSFLVSAVMMGLCMVSFVSILSSKFFNHSANMGIFSGLARGSIITIAFYLILKIYLLLTGPGAAAAFTGSMESMMYLLEMSVGVVIPLILLLLPGIRNSIGGIFLVDILVIGGVVINRMNIAVFGLLKHAGERGVRYFPTGNEIMVTLFLIAFGAVLFKLAVKYLNVLSYEEA
ncbi:MAG: polysulfide reductase NrfD [Nitrospirae bacterium]|nr:polysulfide reductase NrfD [Nitrospirota bacterium]MBI4837650.1 polysulfide reductase NrfD [Nitrospirota bacterium]